MVEGSKVSAAATSMRGITYDRYGGPEELRLAPLRLEAPTGDQVRVRVHAASVNPVDWKIRAGELKMMTGSKFPRGMGEDFAGVVEAVGPGVTRFKVGDEVFGAKELKDAGSFADALVTPERTVALKPAGLSFEAAATLPTVAQTAWLALVDTAQLKPGQRVLVNGCLGSVGRCAVQIARHLKADVSGTCGAAGLAEARSLGVANPIDYARFRPDEHRGRFDAILDASGNLTVAQCSRMLRGGGIAMHINPTFGKMLRTMISPRNKLVFLKTSAALLEQIAALAAEGRITLPIGKTVPLDGAIPAITDLERTGLPKGKVVIAPG